jgi:hypothetical protein
MRPLFVWPISTASRTKNRKEDVGNFPMPNQLLPDRRENAQLSSSLAANTTNGNSDSGK